MTDHNNESSDDEQLLLPERPLEQDKDSNMTDGKFMYDDDNPLVVKTQVVSH